MLSKWRNVVPAGAAQDRGADQKSGYFAADDRARRTWRLLIDRAIAWAQREMAGLRG